MGSMKFLVVLALFAMAMAEPEADHALIYTTNTLPLTSGVHSPLVYNSAVQTPLVYNSAVQTPLVYKTLPVDEKTEKVSTPLVYTHGFPVHQPVVYKTLPVDEKTEKVSTPLVYTRPPPSP